MDKTDENWVHISLPRKPNLTIVTTVEPDGTVLKTAYNAEGDLLSTEVLTDLIAGGS